MELFIPIVFCCVFFYVGYKVGEALTLIRVKGLLAKFAKMAGVDLEQFAKEVAGVEDEVKEISTTTVLHTETHHGILYLFDKESDAFICQGNTIEELAKLAKEQKQIIEAVVEHGEERFLFHDGIPKSLIIKYES